MLEKGIEEAKKEGILQDGDVAVIEGGKEVVPKEKNSTLNRMIGGVLKV